MRSVRLAQPPKPKALRVVNPHAPPHSGRSQEKQEDLITRRCLRAPFVIKKGLSLLRGTLNKKTRTKIVWKRSPTAEDVPQIVFTNNKVSPKDERHPLSQRNVVKKWRDSILEFGWIWIFGLIKLKVSRLVVTPKVSRFGSEKMQLLAAKVWKFQYSTPGFTTSALTLL